jgi:cation diffusion facilitator family transporter
LIASRENYSIQKGIAIIAVVLFILKLAAWYITGSVAILTDTLESIVNVVSGFIGLYSLYLAAIPKDLNHPYGHGKAEFLSAAVEGSLISFAGFVIIYQAIMGLRHPHPILKLDYGIYIVAFTGAVNFAVGYYAIKHGTKNNSLALIASGKHLHTDTYSTIGIVIGLALIKITGFAWLDSAVALLFAIVIIVTGIGILRTSIAGIMDEADKKLLDEVVEYLNGSRRLNWIDLHNLRIIKYGSVLHLDCHLTVPWYLNIREAHHEVKLLEEKIQQKYGESVEMFVHLDSCEKFQCPLCQKPDCSVRQYPFVKRIEWNVDNISANAKHRLDTADQKPLDT